jgi:hypothetical protein
MNQSASLKTRVTHLRRATMVFSGILLILHFVQGENKPFCLLGTSKSSCRAPRVFAAQLKKQRSSFIIPKAAQLLP